MPYLRSDPPLFDADAWRARLAKLHAEEPASERRDDLIALAEAHLASVASVPAEPAA